MEEREAAARAHHRSPLRARGRHRHDRPHLRVGTPGGGRGRVERPAEAPKTAGPGPGSRGPRPTAGVSVSGSGTTREGELESGARGAPRVPTRARGPSPPRRPARSSPAGPGPHPRTGNWEKPRPQSRVWRPLPRREHAHGPGTPSPADARGRRPVTSPDRDLAKHPIQAARPKTGPQVGPAPGPARPGVGRQPRSGTRKNQEAWPDTEGPTPGRPRGRGTAFPQFLLGRRPRAADTVRAA